MDASGCAGSQLDDDNDGVMNNLDECSNTAPQFDVGSDGCAIVTSNPSVDVDSGNGLPGFTALVATIALLGAALIRRD